ncbi:MAG: hypothetical protein GY927_17535, partial [bacterium]|nr:hypothetical protein [bacterium]
MATGSGYKINRFYDLGLLGEFQMFSGNLMHGLIKLTVNALLIFLVSVSAISSQAASFQLKPHKDKLFKYRTAIKIEDKGGFIRAPYDPLRDINGRDEIPVR